MIVFSIIIFGLAVTRDLFRFLISIKNKESNVSILGTLTALITMIIAYIWFLNLIVK
jgi:hypothetical protein